MLSDSLAKQKAYLDSGASIHVTGNESNLTNKRPSALQIQGYSSLTWARATAVGTWGPLREAHAVEGAQDLVSTGALIDDVGGGVYSNSTDAYLLSGLDTDNLPPGLHATKIATRDGPGKLYETDMQQLLRAIRRRRRLHTAYNAFEPEPLICNISAKVNKRLHAELQSLKEDQSPMWFTPEAEPYREDEIMRALFPVEQQNPWSDLPVIPRTPERAEAERNSFPHVLRAHPVELDSTRDDSNVLAQPSLTKVDFDRSAPAPKRSWSHDAIRARLLRKHRCMGHPSKRIMQKMLEQSDSKQDRDLARQVRKHMPHCNECMFGKPRQKPHPKKASGHSKATEFLERLVIDCSGSQAVKTTSGYIGYVLIVDEYTRYSWVYFFKSVSECPGILENFLRKIGKHTKDSEGKVRHVQLIRSDGGADFGSFEFDRVLDKHNIQHECIPADSSEQNGIVERRIGVIGERVRTILNWSQLPQSWWAEAVKYVVQMLNLTPSYSHTNYETPYKMRTGKDHSQQLLQPFGCLTCSYIKPVRRAAGKLSPAGQVGIFLSYDDRSDGGIQGYRVFNWDTGRVVHRYDCDFNQDLPAMEYIAKMMCTSSDAQFLNRRVCKDFDGEKFSGTVTRIHKGKLNQTLWHIKYDDGDREDVDFQELLQILTIDADVVNQRIALQQPRLDRQYTEDSEGSNATEGPEGSKPNAQPRRSTRQRTQRKQTNVSAMGDIDGEALDSTARYGAPPRGSVMHTKQIGAGMHPDDLVPEMVIDFDTAIARDLPKSKNYKDAMRGPLRRYWAGATKTELDNMTSQGVWKIVPTPKDGSARNPIRLKWVLKIKKKQNSTVDKFRARLCAQGCRQVEGRDYHEKTAPVLHAVSLRTLFMLANELGWEVHQLDVSCAYLNAYLEQGVTLYLVPPEGMKLPKGYSLLCLKALYGLVQAGNRWAKLKTDTLTKLGYVRNAAEPCMWRRSDSRGTVILGIIVDDFAITGHPTSAIDASVKELMTVWNCTYMGKVKWILNMRVTRKPGVTIIDQSEYVEEILDELNMSDAKPVTTPAELGLHLSKSMGPTTREEIADMRDVPYTKAVGKTLYLRLTRLDAIAAIANCARFMANPGRIHWKALKRILRYLSGTRYWGLIYRATGKTLDDLWDVILYVDSDHASDPDTRKSRYGFIIIVNGCPVAFGTGMRKKPSASTPEAEYVALSHGLRELLWLLQILKAMGVRVKTPVPVYEDNQTCIAIANNRMSQKRTRYLDVRYHFIRDYVEDRTIQLYYCETAKMLADILTKAIPRPQYQRLREQVMTDVLSYIGGDLLVQVAYCKTMLDALTI